MNAAVQVCWEKAARYLEVEERYWNTRPGVYIPDPQELVDLVDENTILVCAILGTTYTGQYEDVSTINDLLEKKNKAEGLNVHIHVDAASGGFVAPFVVPDLKWDFRNKLVCSINTSGEIHICILISRRLNTPLLLARSQLRARKSNRTCCTHVGANDLMVS